MAKRRSELDKDRESRRHWINHRYALRHPAKAREERRLRKAQALAERDFAHKNEGTVETHGKASAVRQGALARLYQSGAIDADQLAWAQEIAQVHDRIAREVDIRTISLETRIDGGGGGEAAFWESLATVRREIAYTRWRGELPHPAAPILAMIVGDIGVTIAARRHGMGVKRAKALLIGALDLWPEMLADARRACDAADLAAMQAGLV